MGRDASVEAGEELDEGGEPGQMAVALVLAKVRAHRRLPTPTVRRALREDAGLSQDDIARAIGVHRETVSRWESGERTPRGQRLLAYYEFLEHLRELAS